MFYPFYARRGLSKLRKAQLGIGVITVANRSYLYSTNVIPGPNAKAYGQKLIGISEWKYDIPIVFKLLLSGNTKTCPSSIWNNQDEIALIGDYAAGLRNLEHFLSRVTLPSALPLITEAFEFLRKPENQNEYFILECGEIFDLIDTPFIEQNLALIEQIQNLQSEIDAALQSLLSPEQSNLVHDPMEPIYALGLGHWSNILYFNFTNHIDQLLDIVRRGDGTEIEGARDLVKPQDMDALVEAYWILPTVNDKAGLMQLFSDHIAPGGRAVMLDFLKIPANPTALNYEYITLGKINAMCQLEGHFKNFNKYWDSYLENEALLEEVIQRYLDEQVLSHIDTKQNKWWKFWKRKGK